MTGSPQMQIVVVRLGAMGDILHTLPAVASLKRSWPDARITWVMAPKWKDLLEGNPDVDEIVSFDRRDWNSIASCWRQLRRIRPQIAVDYQGLLQSALVARASRPQLLVGRARSCAREPLAVRLYHREVRVHSAHVVDQNLELSQAAGAHIGSYAFPVPQGEPDGILPEGPFVLTHPFAGWASKQWPVDRYGELAQLLLPAGVTLVANIAPSRMKDLTSIPGLFVHTSSLKGLIDATRKATAVLGLDSGPMHLAAALAKPGVALFGPTDPLRNGPYGSSFTTLRAGDAVTSYKRKDEPDASMRSITVDEVYQSLMTKLALAGSRS